MDLKCAVIEFQVREDEQFISPNGLIKKNSKNFISKENMEQLNKRQENIQQKKGNFPSNIIAIANGDNK